MVEPGTIGGLEMSSIFLSDVGYIALLFSLLSEADRDSCRIPLSPMSLARIANTLTLTED
jgi:hypothetical protein